MVDLLVTAVLSAMIVGVVYHGGVRLYALLRERYGLPAASEEALALGLCAVAFGLLIPAASVARSVLDGAGLAEAAETARPSLWPLVLYALAAFAGAGVYAAVRHVDRVDAEEARQRAAARDDRADARPLP